MKLYFIIFFACCFLISCTTTQNTLSDAKVISNEEIENLQKRWQSHDIKTYYYDLQFDCQCELSGKYKVAVRSGYLEYAQQTEAKGVTLAEPEFAADMRQFKTFDDLYKWAIKFKSEGSTVKIKADDVYSYPEIISIEGKDLITLKITNLIDRSK